MNQDEDDDLRPYDEPLYQNQEADPANFQYFWNLLLDHDSD